MHFHIINAITKEDAKGISNESLQTELTLGNVGVRSDIRRNRFFNSGIEGQRQSYKNNGELGVHMEGRNSEQSYGSEKLTAKDKEALQSVRNQLKQATKSGGEVRGFNLNGKVYTFPEGMNAETLLHEGSGVWFDVLRSNNRKGYESAKKVLKSDLSDLISEIKNDPNYKGLLNDEDAVLKEVFEQFSGKRGAARLE